MKKALKHFVSILLCTAVLGGLVFGATESSSSKTSSSSSDSSSSTVTFTSTDNVKKAQVAMATNEYIVTAGDIYTLAYSGGSFSISVDSTYRVRIANLGIINAEGLTLQEFKNKVESLIVNNYPNGGIQFFLSNPAQFHVYVKGEVEQARTLEAWALMRASEIVKEFATDYSSTRLFTVVSADGSSKKYDLFKADRYGDFTQDPYLRPGDTIVVQKLDRLITINGAVKRPGTYELLAGEELKSLIFDYADGFDPYADKNNIQVERFTGNADLYEAAGLKETDLHIDTPLACYDKVFVASFKNQQPVFYVEGAINAYYDTVEQILHKETDSEGNEVLTDYGSVVTNHVSMAKLKFPLSKGRSCIQMVLENSEMFTNSSDLTNAYVWRNSNDKNNEEKIKINLNAVLYPSKNQETPQDIILEADDILVIPVTQYYVTVTGAVGMASTFAYQPDRDWKYYVNLSGGINKTANPFSIVKITDKNGKTVSKKSSIPPEANIYSYGYTPAGSWVISLSTTPMTFITTTLSFYLTMKALEL